MNKSENQVAFDAIMEALQNAGYSVEEGDGNDMSFEIDGNTVVVSFEVK